MKQGCRLLIRSVFVRFFHQLFEPCPKQTDRHAEDRSREKTYDAHENFSNDRVVTQGTLPAKIEQSDPHTVWNRPIIVRNLFIRVVSFGEIQDRCEENPDKYSTEQSDSKNSHVLTDHVVKGGKRAAVEVAGFGIGKSVDCLAVRIHTPKPTCTFRIGVFLLAKMHWHMEKETGQRDSTSMEQWISHPRVSGKSLRMSITPLPRIVGLFVRCASGASTLP